jgi:hypothetical protein
MNSGSGLTLERVRRAEGARTKERSSVRKPPVSLRLVDARKLDGSETLLVRYEVGPKAG